MFLTNSTHDIDKYVNYITKQVASLSKVPLCSNELNGFKYFFEEYILYEILKGQYHTTNQLQGVNYALTAVGLYEKVGIGDLHYKPSALVINNNTYKAAKSKLRANEERDFGGDFVSESIKVTTNICRAPDINNIIADLILGAIELNERKISYVEGDEREYYTLKGAFYAAWLKVKEYLSFQGLDNSLTSDIFNEIFGNENIGHLSKATALALSNMVYLDINGIDNEAFIRTEDNLINAAMLQEPEFMRRFVGRYYRESNEIMAKNDEGNKKTNGPRLILLRGGQQ